MLKNYIKIAWRNLTKDKTNTLLNIIGLSVAFAVAILLSMAAFFELSFDDFHENGQNTYEVYSVTQKPKGPEAGTSQAAPFAKVLRDEVPGISKITRVLNEEALVLYKDKQLSLDAVWVDTDFFSMFTFPIINGNKDQAFNEQSSVVLTEEIATKIFGKTDVVGETLNILIDGEERPFSVAAVAENNVPQSSITFEIAIPFENHSGYLQDKDNWNSQYHSVYVTLQDGISANQFEKSAQSFTALHYKENIETSKNEGAIADADGLFKQLKLLPIQDLHFRNYGKGYAEVSRSSSYLIFLMAFVILFIASVNYINMSIAKSSQRLKEIGMRKTLGAEKKQLFFQFWSESVFIFAVSVGLGVLLSLALLDDFKSIFDTDVSLDFVQSPMVIIGFLFTIFLITLIVGGYPALLLSKLGTIQSLKGKVESSGKNRVRDVLMIVQFSIAILLIIGTLVLWNQVAYMRNKDLGFNKEQVISFPLNGKRESHAVLNLLREELRGNPDVLSVSASDNNLGLGKDGNRSASGIGFGFNGRTIFTNFLAVDYNYANTLGLQMAQGRNFRSEADSIGVVINEAMAKQFEEEDILSLSLPIDSGTPYPILGVVKDYNFEDLDRAIGPITFLISKSMVLEYAYVKVAPTNMATSFETIENVWKQLEPNSEFLGSFLDENIDRTFKKEKTMATMITSGSILAITLSCIGLFAMSLLIVTQRTKEIGIRKVVGASVLSITYILTRDFLKLVVISFLIASPIAWYFMRQWLENYEYRTELNAGVFLLAGLLAVGIALLTIGARTVKAAMANPIDSLRDE